MTIVPYVVQACFLTSGAVADAVGLLASHETDTALARGFGLAARRFAAVAHARLAARRYYATC